MVYLIRPQESSEFEKFKSNGAEDRPEGSSKPVFEKEGRLRGSRDSIWRTGAEQLPNAFNFYNVEQSLDTFYSNERKKSKKMYKSAIL